MECLSVRSACLVIAAIAIAGCGGGSGDSPSGPSAVDPGGSVGSTGARTYYVAINEPGADNDRCDGSSPTNLGGGRCPFRDFRSPRTFSLVNNVGNVRLEVRRGTYSFVNEGLSITGTGRSIDESAVLAAYNGEEVIFDGEERLNATLRVAGQFVTVTGITFIRGGGYNVELRGARQARILNNRFLSNRSSDSLKGTDGAADVEVRGNTFTRWDSQAIDVTGVSRWTISDNLFHDALRGTGPLGAKSGSRDVRFTDNRIRNAGGLSMGGTSAAHPNAYEAYDIVAERNTFDRVVGHAAMVYSCLGCRFTDNTVSTAERGLRLGGVLFQGTSGCVGGCQASRNTTVSRNRFRDVTGDREAPSDVFWLVDPADQQGLSATDNLYCVSPGQSARFAVAPTILDFTQWTRTAQTDGNSMVLAASDSRCQGW